MSEQINTEIKFGTDGWRGVISDNFTFKNVAIVAQGISEWVNRHLRKKTGASAKRVAVGYDTRFLSDEYARIVSSVLAANNIEVLHSQGAIPTPALSFGVIRQECVAGVMITASHNPGKFNGVKIKTGQGGGASKDITDTVEDYLYQSEVRTVDFDVAKSEKKIILHDYKDEYIKFIRDYIDFKKIKSANFKVLVDAMHGSGNGLMAKVLEGTKIRLSLMRDDVNPSFEGGKPEPVVEYLEEILRRVKQEKFDLGLVLDGDGGRVYSSAEDLRSVDPSSGTEPGAGRRGRQNDLRYDHDRQHCQEIRFKTF